ncbi:MAG: glutamine--fructose-6-phosphate transaminase (isomerizing) [Bacteroidales bacterium]|jgi:glucosamine--fructose-6-phosphate aminotransferase (isomerizing)|nr:glutamine--fructose-6-phosphate transaminase (isomerizing) [Bacteroidales bacterium]MBQ4477838.1 glutamine--fructose-6-phosphate transaminase (isomerizing) [Bacteroidales bacterium]MBR4454149.1 glutamine--fructose-6-phosphate transaminase (isomerizing) [Bacteroidales bacterium]MCR5554216.1 glutamine--fructose-6-phosphate transaminase (isomerizing) [Bacteroidales bacterium]
MCGIVGYVGNKEAFPVLIKGLYRMEYRGYDSAGVAIVKENEINIHKCHGRVSDLEEFCKDKDVTGTCGIAHTRWATHGEPNDQNAHPHFSSDKKIALIHNGIIENHLTLKVALEKNGYIFNSETDTEVLIHLIEDVKKNENLPLAEAVRVALSQVVGTYGIIVVSSDEPDTLIVAKKGSPVIIGFGKNEYYVASDGAALIEYTNKVVYLNDEEIAVLTPGNDLQVKTIKNKKVSHYAEKLQLSLEELEKGGYPHFMLKEIYEQPRSIADSMRGRLNLKKDVVSLGGIVEYEDRLLNARRIVIVACGTSYHAGLVGEHLFEDLLRIPVEVEYASEFRYRNPVIYEDDVVIAISQSGETADTLAAIELSKKKGATVLGICNVVGSSIARATDAGSYTHAGPEIGVASTKAFTAQVTVLALMALCLADKKKKIPKKQYVRMVEALEKIPDQVKQILQSDEKVKEIASYIKDHTNALYLGRNYNYPVALEGALKLKEISYIHAEGYPAAEMKHGPIALIDENMPVIVIAVNSATYEKVVSNIQEVKARKGKIISIVTEGDKDVAALSDYVIEIPKTEELFTPILTSIPLQLLAYHAAVMCGRDVDRPRNLAKSVTVE